MHLIISLKKSSFSFITSKIIQRDVYRTESKMFFYFDTRSTNLKTTNAVMQSLMIIIYVTYLKVTKRANLKESKTERKKDYQHVKS